MPLSCGRRTEGVVAPAGIEISEGNTPALDVSLTVRVSNTREGAGLANVMGMGTFWPGDTVRLDGIRMPLGGAATVRTSQAAAAAAPAEEVGVMQFCDCVPGGFTSIKLTVIRQAPPAGMVPPLNCRDVDPGAAPATGPQVEDEFGGDATLSPGGRESVNATALSVLEFGLTILIINVDTPPEETCLGLNAVFATGGTAGGRI